MLRKINKINDPAIIAELRTFPTQAVIWEIVDEGITGEIYELQGGAILIIENSNDPFVFIAGNLTDKSAQSAMAFLKNRGYTMIYCNPCYHSLFLNRGFDLLLRAELRIKDLKKFYKSDVPQMQGEVKAIDNLELFEKCFWYENISKLYGSPEKALSYCVSYAYVVDDKVLSEAYGNIGGGYMELGVAVSEKHRGRGYVIKALIPLIEKCEAQGLIPLWTCQLDNRSSLRAALKLGFELDRYYVTLVPECGNILGANLVKWMKDNPKDMENPFL